MLPCKPGGRSRGRVGAQGALHNPPGPASLPWRPVPCPSAALSVLAALPRHVSVCKAAGARWR